MIEKIKDLINEEKKITITYNNGSVKLKVDGTLSRNDVIELMEECIKKIKEF